MNFQHYFGLENCLQIPHTPTKQHRKDLIHCIFCKMEGLHHTVCRYIYKSFSLSFHFFFSFIQFSSRFFCPPPSSTLFGFFSSPLYLHIKIANILLKNFFLSFSLIPFVRRFLLFHCVPRSEQYTKAVIFGFCSNMQSILCTT